MITANKPYLQENKISKEYKGFRSFISEKTMHTSLAKIEKAREEGIALFESSENGFTLSGKLYEMGIR